MPRKHSRAIDPETGDRAWDAARGTWASAKSPELAIVQGVLTTELGSAARDRTYGVEGVDNAAPDAFAKWRANVFRALKYWIDNGVLRDVEVTGDVRPFEGTATLVYTVTFKGASGRPDSFSGQR